MGLISLYDTFFYKFTQCKRVALKKGDRTIILNMYPSHIKGKMCNRFYGVEI